MGPLYLPRWVLQGHLSAPSAHGDRLSSTLFKAPVNVLSNGYKGKALSFPLLQGPMFGAYVYLQVHLSPESALGLDRCNTSLSDVVIPSCVINEEYTTSNIAAPPDKWELHIIGLTFFVTRAVGSGGGRNSITHVPSACTSTCQGIFVRRV